jgi:hypothetical protein
MVPRRDLALVASPRPHNSQHRDVCVEPFLSEACQLLTGL